MSTYYTLLKRADEHSPACEGSTPSDSPAVEVGIDERSNKFDLYVYSRTLDAKLIESAFAAKDPQAPEDVAVGLTFADLRKIRDRIDEVLGYFEERK
jgi:sialic acid synthase SpsE